MTMVQAVYQLEGQIVLDVPHKTASFTHFDSAVLFREHNPDWTVHIHTILAPTQQEVTVYAYLTNGEELLQRQTMTLTELCMMNYRTQQESEGALWWITEETYPWAKDSHRGTEAPTDEEFASNMSGAEIVLSHANPDTAEMTVEEWLLG